MITFNVIKQIRNTIYDTASPYRFTDDKIVSYINICLREIRSMRPDLIYDSDGELIDFEAAVIYPRWQVYTEYSQGTKVTDKEGYFHQCVTAGRSGAVEPLWANIIGQTTNDGTVVWRRIRTDELILSDKWLTSIVHYVVYKLYEEESDDMNDFNRAQHHLQLFQRGVYQV